MLRTIREKKIDSKKVVKTPTLVLFSVQQLIYMPADYRSSNFENPTKSSGVMTSQSDPDFYKFCRVCHNSKWRTTARTGLLEAKHITNEMFASTQLIILCLGIFEGQNSVELNLSRNLSVHFDKN